MPVEARKSSIGLAGCSLRDSGAESQNIHLVQCVVQCVLANPNPGEGRVSIMAWTRAECKQMTSQTKKRVVIVFRATPY